LGEDVSCPACGRPMLPTSGGHFCPACKHRSSQSTIFEGGSETPPLGLKIGSPREDTAPNAVFDRDGTATPVPGAYQPVGGSIFDSAPGLDSSPVFDSGPPTPAPMSRPSPASFIDAPGEEPELRFADDDGQGAFGETVVIPGKGKRSPSTIGDDDVSSVLPEKKDALFLPRCKSCNEVLELEEIADGECAKCRGLGHAPVGRRSGRKRPAPGPSPGVMATVSGTLAAVAATWVGVLVVVRAVRSGPDTWGGPQVLAESWRMGLVLFALTASILWAYGKSWAGGAALALGTLAAALAAVMVRSGGLIGDIHAASAWLLAGASGALAAAAAVVPRHEFAAPSARRGGRGGGRRRPRNTSEVMAAPSRRARARGTGVSRPRAVIGGLAALALAGIAGWRAKVAFDAAPGALRTFGPDALRLYGLGTAALFMGSVALWLFFSPPRGKTSLLALLAAAAAVPLPVWLAIGPRLAWSAGLGHVDASGWLALPGGLGRLLGMEYLADLAPAGLAPELKIAAAVALGIGLLASLFVLFSRSAARGRGLAGLALACVLVWGAGLSFALVPPPAPESTAASQIPADADEAADDAGDNAGNASSTEDPGPSGESDSTF